MYVDRPVVKTPPSSLLTLPVMEKPDNPTILQAQEDSLMQLGQCRAQLRAVKVWADRVGQDE